MTELFAALLAMTLSGTLAALTAFALKKAAGDRLSPAFGCYIWLPVLLLFLLPAAMPLPDILRLPLDRILVAAGSQAQQTVPALVEGAQTASSVLADPQPAQKLIFSAMLPRSRQLQLAAAMPLLVLWAGGAVFFALVRGMDYRRIRNYLAEHSSLCGKRAQGLFDRAAETAGLSGKVKLRLCPGAVSYTHLPVGRQLLRLIEGPDRIAAAVFRQQRRCLPVHGGPQLGRLGEDQPGHIPLTGLGKGAHQPDLVTQLPQL